MDCFEIVTDPGLKTPSSSLVEDCALMLLSCPSSYDSHLQVLIGFWFGCEYVYIGLEVEEVGGILIPMYITVDCTMPVISIY